MKTSGFQLSNSLFALWAVCLGAFLTSPAMASTQCYVRGDTSGNNQSHPLGSIQNPYGSLAAVESDADCVEIFVLFSSVVLDGGIALKNGQTLHGKKGPGGLLPKLTNNTGANYGAGVVLARDNELKHLHILNTQFSGIIGWFELPPFDFGGNVLIQSVLVTGANQSGAFVFEFMAVPSVVLSTNTDANFTILNSDIGQANVPSIGVFQGGGNGNLLISNTTVRDQGQLSENFEESPGILVYTFDSGSMDAAIIDTTVSNIGSEFVSNSDGLLLLNFGSGAMTAQVDNYRYSNPDQGGFIGTSTGIEMGMIFSSGGGSFDGVVTNSVIEDAFFRGIQVLDDTSVGGNTVIAEIRDNQISGSVRGIQAYTHETPFSSMYLDISGNTIADSAPADCGCPRGENPVGIQLRAGDGTMDVFSARIENNTIVDTQGIGLQFVRLGSANTMQVDAGWGALGSEGQNRIIDTVGVDVLSDGVPVSAANNWWGSEDGPASVVELNGGVVDVTPFLTREPKGNKN